jgi:hypothetical protein
MLRLTPRLPRSVGFWPVFFPPERGLAHRSVHRQPGPVDAHEVVVLEEAGFPEGQENAGLHPLLEAVMGRRTRTDTAGVQRLPLAAGAQDEEDGVEAIPVRASGSAAAEAVGILVGRYPTLQLLPQFVGDTPLVRGCLLIVHCRTSCPLLGIQEF